MGYDSGLASSCLERPLHSAFDAYCLVFAGLQQTAGIWVIADLRMALAPASAEASAVADAFVVGIA